MNLKLRGEEAGSSPEMGMGSEMPGPKESNEQPVKQSDLLESEGLTEPAPEAAPKASRPARKEGKDNGVIDRGPSARDMEVTAEIKKGDFTHVHELRDFTPELAVLIGKDKGKATWELDTSGPAGSEIRKTIENSRSIIESAGHPEYNSGNFLNLEGMTYLDDPEVARAIVNNYKGAIWIPHLLGGSEQALAILFTHHGPVIAPSLSYKAVKGEALRVLAKRNLITEVNDPRLQEAIKKAAYQINDVHIARYKKPKPEPEQPSFLEEGAEMAGTGVAKESDSNK